MHAVGPRSSQTRFRARASSTSRPTTLRRSATVAASPAVPAQVALTVAAPVDGTPLELVYQPPADASPSSPPILLVHGSYHAAWCWRDTFMPYLASRGWSSYAVSLRGQGASGRVPAPGLAADAKVAGTLATHARDLAAVVAAVAAGVGSNERRQQGTPSPSPTPPVVVAHSFGGLILQELVSSPSAAPAPIPLSGAAYLGSVPPSGNKAMVGRFLKRDPWASAKLTYAFVAASFARDAKACRECFLSREAPDALAEEVRAKIAAGLSPLRLIDLNDMNKRVPLAPPSAKAATPHPTLVLRGTEDGVVDAEAAEELAAWAAAGGGTRRVEIERLAHDVMLDARWEEAARELVGWLETL